MQRMTAYQPDYRRIVAAARNEPSDFVPLYDHQVSWPMQEALLSVDLRGMLAGEARDREEAFGKSAALLASLGYDIYPFEIAQDFVPLT